MNTDFPNEVNVTGQIIDLTHLTNTQKEFYAEVFNSLVKLYSSRATPRLLVGFAGPTGAGKSVLLAIFKTLAERSHLQFDIATVGIDAYSYTNEYLLSHPDGDSTLKSHKGRYDTYDVPKLISDLDLFKKGREVSFPEYSRVTHNPIECSTAVSGQNTLLLIEGLWLLRDVDTWKQVGEFLDYTYFVNADKEKVRDATIRRHTLGGRTLEDAERYYDEVDSANFDLVSQTAYKADTIIPAYYTL